VAIIGAVFDWIKIGVRGGTRLFCEKCCISIRLLSVTASNLGGDGIFGA